MWRTHWLRSRPKPNRRPAPYRPQLESLEDRMVPSALALSTYSRLSLSFEANQGQADAQVNFLSRGQGYSLFLTPTQAVLDLSEGSGARAQGSAEHVLQMPLVASNPAPD